MQLSGIPTDLLETDILGVKEAIANLTERGAIDPVVKATVVLSESGFAAIQDAVAYGEIKDSSITGKVIPAKSGPSSVLTRTAGKLKGLFGGGSSSQDDNTDKSVSADSTDKSSVSDATSTSTSDTASATPEKKPTLKEQETIPLGLEVKPLSIPALTPSEKRESRNKFVNFLI